jgi:hypothetical protein
MLPSSGIYIPTLSIDSSQNVEPIAKLKSSALSNRAPPILYVQCVSPCLIQRVIYLDGFK